MRRGWRYLVPGLIAAVLLWGLLSLAEKLALMLGIAACISFMLYLWREERGRGSVGREVRDVTPSRQDQCRVAFSALLREALHLKPGRVKEAVEQVAVLADAELTRFEHEGCGAEDLAQRLDQVRGDVERYRQLAGQPQSTEAERIALESRLRRAAAKFRQPQFPGSGVEGLIVPGADAGLDA